MSTKDEWSAVGGELSPEQKEALKAATKAFAAGDQALLFVAVMSTKGVDFHVLKPVIQVMRKPEHLKVGWMLRKSVLDFAEYLKQILDEAARGACQEEKGEGDGSVS